MTERLDMGRLSKMVSRPGIDPRFWVSHAQIDAVMLDPAEGLFAEVTLLPSNMPEIARVTTPYAGNGWGLYLPPRKGDLVIVEAPSGDPNEGLVVSARSWWASDPPPQEVVDHPDDAILVVEKDFHLRIYGKGNGNVTLYVDAGKVYLGDDSGTEPIAKGTTLKQHLQNLRSTLGTHTHPFVGVAAGSPGTTAASATVWPDVPDIEAAKAEVK